MNKYQHNSLCFIYKHIAKLRRHLPTNLGWLINSWIWNYNLIMLLACILRIERNCICGNDHSAGMRHGWVGTLFRFTVLQPTLGWHSAAKKKRIGVPKNSDMRGFNAESLKIHISSTHTHKKDQLFHLLTPAWLCRTSGTVNYITISLLPSGGMWWTLDLSICPSHCLLTHFSF